MFSRKKPVPEKRRNHDLSQFGLMEIPDDFDPTSGYGEADEDDSDLEAELAAISGGGRGQPKPKSKPKPQLNADLDKMIADSMKDIGEVSEDEDDADLEQDTDLLGELQNIVGVENNGESDGDGCTNSNGAATNQTTGDTLSTLKEDQQIVLPTTTVDTIGIIQQRIEMYKQAEASAKAAGESAKVRRFGRGLKNLLDLQKQVNAGKTVNVEDIPPEVSVKPQSVNDMPMVPSRSAPPPPPPTVSTPGSDSIKSVEIPVEEETSNQTNPILEQLRIRQQEYKAAALQSKRNGDTKVALQFLKVVKQFDMVINMVHTGQAVDLSDMPPPPEQFLDFMAKIEAAAAEAPKSNDADSAPSEQSELVTTPLEDISAPASMLESLQQRLDKYKSVEESAKIEGNASKARRFGRIVKQYEDAIKQYKAGRTVAYDELPIPPGFGALPVEVAVPPKSATIPSAPNTSASTTSTVISTEENTSSHGSADSKSDVPPTRTSPHKHDLTTRTSGNQHKNNLAEQQMKILLERQKEFKLAAIEAKKAGEIDQAKEYLKIYKGFDALLNAASSGLPVDLNTLPLPPSQRDSLESTFAIVTAEECDPDDDMSDIGVRIEEQLAKQLMMCKNTRDHHKAMGDVAGMNRFENLAVTVQKDLDLVRYSKRKNLSLPKFHYEKRSFNIVHCNTELTDNELEIFVLRGLNYSVPNPKEVDTYVKIEFPLLNDESFKAKTAVIKNTDSPDYDQRFQVEIQRGNRQFQRIFKRHGVKFEVYSRGGFLRSDVLIGTVNVKLQPLETKCDVHDTFNLMDGRKTVGGKLEIKLRVRNPILTKQMEHIEEKWLVLDT